jgi:hypothetical protein
VINGERVLETAFAGHEPRLPREARHVNSTFRGTDPFSMAKTWRYTETKGHIWTD